MITEAMPAQALPTKFLPAERSSAEELRREKAVVESVPFLREIIEAMPELVLVLNSRRQILLANAQAQRLFGRTAEQMIGMRIGEAAGCVRAGGPGGCGTTEFCTVCGTGKALKKAAADVAAEEECRICVEPPEKSLDLLVRATPLRHRGLEFTIFAAKDKAPETRRRYLEKLFFHDVLNTAGSVKGLSELVAEAPQSELAEYCGLLQYSSDQLLDQIIAQRDLAAMERGEYRVKVSECPLNALLETMARISAGHPTVRERRIVVVPCRQDFAVRTDRTLLMRVLGNMIKNAAEAEGAGSRIIIGCDARPDGGADIWVQNPTVMPREVQLQVFQPSFSTKGADRGLGTYSMRLLTETYLGGRIAFSSRPPRGTEFRVCLPESPR